ncbi:MAG: 3-phosphoshikimate 1-carboxyvinyltransferase [Sulfolobales archaeon]
MYIRVSGRSVSGTVVAPPSKSYTHRALICSSLAEGISRIVNPSICDDCFATIKALTSLGVRSLAVDESIIIAGGHLKPKADLINCDESGTTLRFVVGLTSLINQRIIITGGKSLLRRPIGELVRALNALGANMLSHGDYPPVISYGGFKGGNATVRGDISSQYVSSLLLISPLAEKEVTLTVPQVESRPYIAMTLRTQESFGVRVKVSDEEDSLTFQITPTNYKPTDFLVEGDWSSITYFLSAAALSGCVKVINVNLDSVQADKEIVNVLKSIGASVRTGDGWVEVCEGRLENFEYDVSDSPDLLPTLAVLAASADGRSVISGVGRCRLKESDRVEAVATNLKKLKVDVEVRDDELIINGTGKVGSGTISSYGDHRIAMAFSILSLRSEGSILIEDPLCVSKSFPNFWKDLTALGVDVEVFL